jgi:predicted DNA-binding protein
MRSLRSAPARRAAAALACVLATASLPSATSVAADAIAVLAIDPYADIKSQLTWVGEQVGNPTLAGFAESFILLGTQGKGLAGLDVKRPQGVVVMSEGGPLPTAHAFVPVKDLDKLLGALQGMTGPVEEADGVRRISPPGAPPLEIAEKDGWAILSQPGTPADLATAVKLIEPLSKDYSLAVEFFPSRMPAEMRDRLKALLDEAARNAAARGQPMDDTALRAGIENLEDVERLTFGLAVDTAAKNVHLDITSVLEAGSPAAESFAYAGKAASTILSPATVDGKQAALRGHYAVDVPAAGQAAVRAGLDQALEQADDDPATRVVASLLRDLVAAMLDTGAIDAGFTVDTAAADESSPLPAVTIGMQVKDGAALQARIKERLGKPGALPPQVKAAFDTGKEGAATLHEITVDVSGTPAAERLGNTVKLTLAVTPDHAFVLAGGDVRKRLAAAVANGGKPVAGAAPIACIDASLAALVGYAARMMKAFQPDDPQGEALGEVAKEAAEKDSTQVQFSMKPIERGATVRLLIDEGALQTVAASTSVQSARMGQGPAPRAVPAVPLRPAQPRPIEKENAPAIAP